MAKRPKFKPKRGQMDYRRARWAPVVNCIVTHRGKVLLVERSRELNLYPGYWNGVSGFLDDRKSLKEKVAEEVGEELGIPRSKIRRVRLGPIFDLEAPKYRKTWIVHPVLVEVKTDTVRLDWEGQRYRWLVPSEVKRTKKLLPGFREVFDRLSPFLRK